MAWKTVSAFQKEQGRCALPRRRCLYTVLPLACCSHRRWTSRLARGLALARVGVRPAWHPSVQGSAPARARFRVNPRVARNFAFTVSDLKPFQTCSPVARPKGQPYPPASYCIVQHRAEPKAKSSQARAREDLCEFDGLLDQPLHGLIEVVALDVEHHRPRRGMQLALLRGVLESGC